MYKIIQFAPIGFLYSYHYHQWSRFKNKIEITRENDFVHRYTPLVEVNQAIISLVIWTTLGFKKEDVNNMYIVCALRFLYTLKKSIVNSVEHV